MSTRSLSPLRRMLGRISAVSSSQYSSSGSIASNEPDDVDRAGQRLRRRARRAGRSRRAASSHVSPTVTGRPARATRPTSATSRTVTSISGVAPRCRSVVGIVISRVAVGRRPALDEPDVVGDVLLDPQPDEARVVGVLEDRPADRLRRGSCDRGTGLGRRPGIWRLELLALLGDALHLVGLAGRVDERLLDELDVALEGRRLADLAAERVVGEAVEQARRERGADRRDEDEHDEPDDGGAAVAEAAQRRGRCDATLLVPRPEHGR